jgi:hypothetical protein
MHLLQETTRNLRAEVARLGHEYPWEGDEAAIQAWQTAFDAAAGDLARIETALRAAQTLAGERLR